MEQGQYQFYTQRLPECGTEVTTNQSRTWGPLSIRSHQAGQSYSRFNCDTILVYLMGGSRPFRQSFESVTIHMAFHLQCWSHTYSHGQQSFIDTTLIDCIHLITCDSCV